MEPALQEVHEVTFEDNEYNPGAQRVHVDAPALGPVLVMDPALHDEHEFTLEDNE